MNSTYDIKYRDFEGVFAIAKEGKKYLILQMDEEVDSADDFDEAYSLLYKYKRATKKGM